jgi:adenylate kinase
VRLVTGVPGVGKSTVCDSLRRSGYDVRNLGTMMLEAARGLGIQDRDALRQLPPDTRARLRLDGLRLALPSSILDVHLTISSATGLEAAMPTIPISAIAILEASPEAILRRRGARQGRFDHEQDAKAIEVQQAANRREASRLVARLADVHLVDADQQPAAVVEQVKKALGPP